MKQPKVTDFTEIQPVTLPPLGDYHVCVILDSGIVPVAKCLSHEDAEKAELAINQAMIEYRAKSNTWEKEFANAGS